MKKLFVLILLCNFSIGFAQTQKSRTSLPDLDIKQVNWLQIYVGSGYTFYRMRDDADVIKFIKDDNIKIYDLSGSFQLNFGVGYTINPYLVRLVYDYRYDQYKTPNGSGFIIFDMFKSRNTSYDLTHQIGTHSLTIDKLFLPFENDVSSYWGLGIGYNFINDSRDETLSYRLNSQQKTQENNTQIYGHAADFHFIFGKMKLKQLFMELRLGYQLELANRVEDNTGKPGQSTSNYSPNYNTFTLKILLGLIK